PRGGAAAAPQGLGPRHGEGRGMTALPQVDVVMLAYGDEPVLDAAVAAVLGSTDVDVTLTLVDNGCSRTDLDALTTDPRATLLRPGSNLGFTGGVNLGAAQGRGAFVALVNSDAIVATDALAVL